MTHPGEARKIWKLIYHNITSSYNFINHTVQPGMSVALVAALIL
jgi:hypothetical protein